MPEIASKEKEPILALEILKGIKGEGADSNSRTWILSLKWIEQSEHKEVKGIKKGYKIFHLSVYACVCPQEKVEWLLMK